MMAAISNYSYMCAGGGTFYINIKTRHHIGTDDDDAPRRRVYVHISFISHIYTYYTYVRIFVYLFK